MGVVVVLAENLQYIGNGARRQLYGAYRMQYFADHAIPFTVVVSHSIDSIMNKLQIELTVAR